MTLYLSVHFNKHKHILSQNLNLFLFISPNRWRISTPKKLIDARRKASLPKQWHSSWDVLVCTTPQRRCPQKWKHQLRKRHRRLNCWDNQEVNSNQTLHPQWPSSDHSRRWTWLSLHTRSGRGWSSMWAAKIQLLNCGAKVKHQQTSRQQKVKINSASSILF